LKKHYNKYGHEYDTSNIFSDFSSDEAIPEEILKDKPSKRDIKYVKGILSDFGITDIKIPEFESVIKLQQWMNSVIMEKLN